MEVNSDSESSDTAMYPECCLTSEESEPTSKKPNVSKMKKYENAYDNFLKWRDAKKEQVMDENLLLAYLEESKKSKKPSTLFSIYSMLKKMLDIHENIQIDRFPRLLALCKSYKKGFVSSKSKIFTEHEMQKFLSEAPDEEYLVEKVRPFSCTIVILSLHIIIFQVVSIFGVFGACRGIDFTQVKVTHIENLGKVALVRIPNPNNKDPKTFVIDGKDLRIVKKYADLRSPKTTTARFFVNYQNGKCTPQVIGKHKFEAMPKKIAIYLGLSEPNRYTSYSFRRTSTTALANDGREASTLNLHGSEFAAEGDDLILHLIKMQYDVAITSLQRCHDDVVTSV